MLLHNKLHLGSFSFKILDLQSNTMLKFGSDRPKWTPIIELNELVGTLKLNTSIFHN